VDKLQGRPVAIKRFQVKGARSWKDVELAEREAHVLARLSHPQLPAHIEHFEEGGALYLVMEKIEGESLAVLREREGPFPRRRIVRFLHDAARVLAYLHGSDPPVIHRDIKPGNVIRRPDGSFALVDFGSVRDRLKPKGGSTVVGTFGYMAPEQFQGRALPATDVYAVGATAISLLTGVEPEDLPHKGLAIDVAAALAGRNDPVLGSVLGAMLEPDPDRRASSLKPLLARLPLDPADAARRSRGRHFDTAPTEPAAGTPGRGGSPGWNQMPRPPAPPGPPMPPGARPRPSPWLLPPLLGVALVVLLTLLRVGVAIGMRVLLPVALTLLSLLFGRSLVRAAREVREAGRRTGSLLKDAQGRIHPRGRHRHRQAEWHEAPARAAAPARGAPPAARKPEAAAPPRPAADARQRIDDAAAAPAPSPGETTELADGIDEVEPAVRDANSDIRARRGP
jgi:hypothetical protein